MSRRRQIGAGGVGRVVGHDPVVKGEGLEDQGGKLRPPQKAAVGKRGGGGLDALGVARAVVVTGG